MQNIGHADNEFDQTGPPVFLRQSEHPRPISGPAALHPSSPAPHTQEYISVYDQHHTLTSLFSSIMRDVEAEEEGAQTLTNLDALIDIMNHPNEMIVHPTPASIVPIASIASILQKNHAVIPFLRSDCMQAHDAQDKPAAGASIKAASGASMKAAFGAAMKTPSGPSKSKAQHSDDSAAHWSDEAWVHKQYGSTVSDGSNACSDDDQMHGDSLLKGLLNACSMEEKRMSKKPKRKLESLLQPKKVSKRPCQNAKEAGLSEDRICTLYMDLRATAPTTLAVYTKIVSDHATMNVVSLSCIRNILTCKSRAEHSSKYWPDEIWELYCSEVRCAECRKLDVTAKILCPHNSKGRPFKVKDPVVDAKMVPLTDKTGKAKKLVREYKIHLELHQIWEAYGCKKPIESITVEKNV